MIDWVVGGATVAQHACAKTDDVIDGDPVEASRGLSKFAWLSALNASARNCSLSRSVISKCFARLRSRFQYGCARKIFRPAPSEPGAGNTKAPGLSNTTGPNTPAASW